MKMSLLCFKSVISVINMPNDYVIPMAPGKDKNAKSLTPEEALANEKDALQAYQIMMLQKAILENEAKAKSSLKMSDALSEVSRTNKAQQLVDLCELAKTSGLDANAINQKSVDAWKQNKQDQTKNQCMKKHSNAISRGFQNIIENLSPSSSKSKQASKTKKTI